MAQTAISELVRYVRALTGEISSGPVAARPEIHLHFHGTPEVPSGLPEPSMSRPTPEPLMKNTRQLAERLTTHLWRMRVLFDELERVAGDEGRLTALARGWRQEAEEDERRLLETLLTTLN
jgi:hypothetical protein